MDELLRTSARLTPKLVSMLLYTATRTIKNNLCKLKKSAVEKASIGLFTSCYDSRLFISQVLLLFASLDLSRVRPLTSGPPAFAPQKPEEKKKKKKRAAQTPLQAPAVKKTGAGDLRIWRVA